MSFNWSLSNDDIKAGALGAGLLRRAPFLVSLALTVAIAYVLAQLTWLLASGPALEIASPASPVATSTAPPDKDGAAAFADQIASMHLFGRAQTHPEQQKAINAPETNLNITLHGIIAANDPDQSRAIIVTGNKDAKSYATGAGIPGGASISDIYADRVILSRNGRLETLKLPNKDEGDFNGISRVGSGASRPQTAPAPVPLSRSNGERNRPARKLIAHSAPPPSRDAASNSQQAISGAGRLVRAQPTRVNGKLIGYRLYPGANPAAFTNAGLEPGDVVTQVNGKPVTNPKSLFLLMKKAKSGQSVNLTIKRGGKTRKLDVALQK